MKLSGSTFAWIAAVGLSLTASQLKAANADPDPQRIESFATMADRASVRQPSEEGRPARAGGDGLTSRTNSPVTIATTHPNELIAPTLTVSRRSPLESTRLDRSRSRAGASGLLNPRRAPLTLLRSPSVLSPDRQRLVPAPVVSIARMPVRGPSGTPSLNRFVSRRSAQGTVATVPVIRAGQSNDR